MLINECMAMANELLAMCDHRFKEDKVTFSMKKEFPRLAKLVPCRLIIPLQESLIASLPPVSSMADSDHHPFPSDLPTFHSTCMFPRTSGGAHRPPVLPQGSSTRST